MAGDLDYVIARGWEINYGEMFSQLDIDLQSKVALLGKSVTEELFGLSEPGRPDDPVESDTGQGHRGTE